MAETDLSAMDCGTDDWRNYSLCLNARQDVKRNPCRPLPG